MPQDKAPPVIQDINLDTEPFVFPQQEYSERYALSLVNKNFNEYEIFRSNNHDNRWNTADALYLGFLAQKVWEGTTIPRSSLPMQIVFDQIEAALPAITQELFTPQDEFFQVGAEPGTDPKEARQVQEHLSYILEHSKNDFSQSGRNEIELAAKDVLMYGNGGLGIEWDSILNRPVIERVDIRDFYIDPNCPTPNVDEARSIIRRKFMTIEELVKLRQDQRMSIPEDEYLYHMSMNPQFAVADQTKRNQEALRGVNYNPQTDYTALPSQRKIEVLIYYSANKIIWNLNREWVAYNEDNPYGFIPFCFAPCYTVPGRFYAQSIADVQESNQRTVEALINARMDAVHMQLMPPRIYKQGQLMTPAQLRWFPGQTYKAGDVKDMALLQPQSELANVYGEIQFVEDAAEKRTGVNSMTSGIPRASNTNRTATGVQAVSSGSMSRLRAIVSNLENYMVVPLLYKLYIIVQKHNIPGQQLPGMAADGQMSQVDSSSFQRKMRFRMLASSRMMTREKLAQVFPFLTQYMLNGTFLGEVQKLGKTVDFLEIFQMLRDATGTGRLYTFIRDMNEQEKKATQAPPPEAQMKMQQTDKELQARMQLGQLKSQTDIQTAQIAHQPDPGEADREQKKAEMEMQQMLAETQQEKEGHAMEMERDQAKIHSEQVLAQIKVQAERDKHQATMAGKQMEMQGKQQEMAINLHGQQQQQAMDLRNSEQTAQMQHQQAQDQHSMSMDHEKESHKVKLTNAKRAGDADLARSKKKAAVRTKARPPQG